jgi:hypothetical protein
LTEEQKLNNIEKSRIRARVHHVFGFIENSRNQMYIKFIVFKRNNAAIGLMNLSYQYFQKNSIINQLKGNVRVGSNNYDN